MPGNAALRRGTALVSFRAAKTARNPPHSNGGGLHLDGRVCPGTSRYDPRALADSPSDAGGSSPSSRLGMTPGPVLSPSCHSGFSVEGNAFEPQPQRLPVNARDDAEGQQRILESEREK